MIFKLLTADKQKDLWHAHCMLNVSMEYREPNCLNWLAKDPSDRFHGEYTYRRVNRTTPSINWDDVHPDFICMATDEDGTTYLCNVEVFYEESIDGWMSEHDYRCIDASAFSSFIPGGCESIESLVRRL